MVRLLRQGTRADPGLLPRALEQLFRVRSTEAPDANEHVCVKQQLRKPM